MSVFLSDVETDAWPEGSILSVAAASARLVVTKGAQGADEVDPRGGVAAIPPTPVPQVADTNGAGDTFATAYMIALLRGDPRPGATASWAASRAVMQPQACKPLCAPALVSGPHGLHPLTARERLMLGISALVGDHLSTLAAAPLHLAWVRELKQVMEGVARRAGWA